MTPAGRRDSICFADSLIRTLVTAYTCFLRATSGGFSTAYSLKDYPGLI